MACALVATHLCDDQSGPVELVPDRVDLAIYLAGWTLGWLLLWRLRPLPDLAGDPSRGSAARPGVAVIIPARNEQDALPHLLSRVLPHIGPQDEVIVVDDHSDDATAISRHGTAPASSHRRHSHLNGSASHTRARSALLSRAHRFSCSSMPTSDPPLTSWPE